jgi:acyl-homoserine-lactone acylase
LVTNIRALKIGVLTLALILFGSVVFLIVADRMGQPKPPDAASLIANAGKYHARIERDTFGVPHIMGPRDADVAFGMGFAHSEDDFNTIQQVALAVRGQLAATEGPKAAVTDYLVRLFRVWETVNAKYERDIPADLRQVLEAYADGVNYYAALHPGQVMRGLLPFTGKDVVAGFVFKLPFFYGLDHELLKLTSPDGRGAISNSGDSAFLRTDTPLPVGSNAVAVGPSRSADGATRLLVNSHQPYTGPVSWYEAVLDSGEGWHVAGGFFPGSPFMLHGHNQHLGWANTVNGPDLVDIYKLSVNPANSNQYRLDGQWRDFQRSEASIRVKIWGPLVWTAHREVLYAEQGPVMKTTRGTFAIRYAGMGEVRAPLQYFRLNKAANLEEWRAAMRLQAIPSLNYVYADEKGNVGYIYNGMFPVRKEGVNWRGVLPGDRSDLIWRSYVPFDREPQLWNPPSGFVFNSNNTPFHATAPDGDLKPEDFPASLGIQTDMTNRAWRAMETYGTDRRITAEAFHAYKYDLEYSLRSDEAKVFDEVLAIDPGTDADLRQAHGILQGWDRRTDVSNRCAALAILTIEPVIRAKLDGMTPRRPVDALRDAIVTLKTHFGRIDPEWGQVNRLRRGTLNLAIDGGPDIFRGVYGELQPDGTLTAMAGDTFIMFVSWDKAGRLTSESIHQFGSATLDRNSPHYADQAPVFAAMKTKAVLFTEAQLAGHVEADYRPGDRERAAPGATRP